MMNGIVTEILRAADAELQWLSILVGFVIPLGVYLVVGIVSVLSNYIQVCFNTKGSNTKCNNGQGYKTVSGNNTQQDTAEQNEIENFASEGTTQEDSDEGKNDTCTSPQGSQCIQLFINVSTILGGVLYFVGDNLHKVNNRETARRIALVFLILGVLIYRITPIALKKLQRYCKDKSNNSKTQAFNLCSPSDKETNSMIIAYTYLLTIAVDFDVWFSIVIKKVDNNITSNLCDRTKDMAIIWSLYGSMIIFFVAIELVIAIIFIAAAYRHSVGKRIPLNLTLSRRPRHTLIRYIALDIVLFMIASGAVALFLVADNQHPLDCYEILTTEYEDESVVRIIFLSLSLAALTVVIVGFYGLKTCG